ncbi:MAG: hypothetical protein GDA38_25815 [Hormoscilla sp. SP12CHS1]|nr:hypothetical protein [Hormoscilla sp. SP12CHS1]
MAEKTIKVASWAEIRVGLNLTDLIISAIGPDFTRSLATPGNAHLSRRMPPGAIGYTGNLPAFPSSITELAKIA